MLSSWSPSGPGLRLSGIIQNKLSPFRPWFDAAKIVKKSANCLLFSCFFENRFWGRFRAIVGTLLVYKGINHISKDIATTGFLSFLNKIGFTFVSYWYSDSYKVFAVLRLSSILAVLPWAWNLALEGVYLAVDALKTFLWAIYPYRPKIEIQAPQGHCWGCRFFAVRIITRKKVTIFL